jgi:protoporphyrinogen oxidase
MEYDYIIIGGGPTGMTLAWLLEDASRKILLIEKENDLGGCHRVERVDGFFTEHGPRVYSTSYLMFIDLLKDMKIDFHTYFTEYKASLSNIDKRTLNSFTINEKKSLFFAFIKLVFDNNFGKNISLKQFCDDNNFTNASRDYIEKFCRLTDGASYEKYTLFQFLQLANQQLFYKLYQPKLPNDKGLIKLWENKLIETGNVTILKNTNVIKLIKDGNKIDSILILDELIVKNIKVKKIILAVPPKPLYNIIKQSPGVENAFSYIEDLEKWKDNNSYFDYIPLTFHYKKNVPMPKISGFPKTEWGIGFIILSNYMDFSDEPSKTVISITITFTDRPNKYGKTVNQCTKKEIIKYIKEVLNFFPEPDLVIISPNVLRHEDKWINLDTAYVVTISDQNNFLKSTSDEFDNLFTVGIHNGHSLYNFTSIESAVQNAIHFCKDEIKDLKYELPVQNLTGLLDIIYTTIIIIFIIIIIIILKLTIFNDMKKL